MGEKGEKGLDGFPGVKVMNIQWHFIRCMTVKLFSYVRILLNVIPAGRERRRWRTRTTRPNGIDTLAPDVLFISAVARPLSFTCLSCCQGYPGEKGTAGSSDIIDFNGKLLDAFQVSDMVVLLYISIFILVYQP